MQNRLQNHESAYHSLLTEHENSCHCPTIMLCYYVIEILEKKSTHSGHPVKFEVRLGDTACGGGL